jgi:CRP-like cAMP-binding protein
MKTLQADYEKYRAMALFADCTATDVGSATELTTRVWFSPGKELATQRRPCRQFGLIIDGTVAVRRDDEEIELLGPGDHFGEFTVLRGLSSPTTLLARTQVTLDVVSPTEFWLTYAANPTLRSRIEGECDRRIRDWVRSPIGEPSTAASEPQVPGVAVLTAPQ